MNLEIEPRPIEVKPLENYKLYIKFKNGEERIYDLMEVLRNKMFKKLKDIEYFKNVKVSGCTVEWQGGEDIAPENLYNDSISIEDYDEKIKYLN